MASVSETQAILLVHGPDRKGIVAAFSQTLFGHGCGIVSSEQHTDTESSIFYQRIVFDAAELHTDRVSLERGIDEVAGRLGMTCEVRWPKPKRVAIFVSKYAHCLWELLLRHDAGELPGVEIVQIVSNHEDLRHVAEHFSVPYAVFKVTKETKRAVEDQELACPVPLTVRGTQALVSFAPLAFKLFYAARQNAVLRRSPFPSP